MKKGKDPSLKRQSSASAGAASGGGDEEVTIVTIDLTDQMLYLDTERATGGRVKGSRSVLQKQKDACRSQPPVFTCRVETVGVVVSNFGDLEKQWVVEMGFGGLLYLQGKRLPRALCYWLMSRFDPVTRTLFLSGSGAGSGCIELPINVGQVHWVFGLPHGDKKVPISKKFTERVKCLKEDLLAEFGEQHQDGSRVVAMKKVVDRVEGNWRQEEELVFKTYFLVLLLGDFIAPTTCARLSPDLFTAVACVHNTNEYDWCSLLLDRLCEAGKKFAKNFYRDGFAKTCGGCTYFLAILYLDHLNIQPKSWGMFPRLKAWSNDDINKVKLDDRFPSEDGKPRKGDFGKTPMRVDQERGLSSDTWESTTKRAASLAKPFVEKEMCADRFDVIFVPVLQNNHWWCASFSVNCEEIWVIDSAGLRRGAKHKDLLAKLCVAIEIFLAKVDPKWIVGSVPTWPVKVVKMEAQEDGNSCGVRMLLAIKACAERFHVEFNLRSHINEEREWLITDDLMNDLNEAKGNSQRGN